MNQSHKIGGKQNVLTIMDNNLAKFYSSRPKTDEDSSKCQCARKNIDKQQQIKYYQNQINLITNTSNSLLTQHRNEDQRIIGNLLQMMVEYINKILELLKSNSFLCECKKQTIMESKIIKHKIQFMREQNEKFFRLYQQKSNECQLLLKQIQKLNLQNQDIDLRPITTRRSMVNTKQEQIMKQSSSLLYPQSTISNQKQSAKSSKISESYCPINAQIKSAIQKDHDLYFKEQTKKKQRKSKIFHENILNL